jgi:WD40 repeat protein
MPLAQPPGDVRVLAFSADGRTLASSDGSRTVRLWDLSTGQLLQSFQETGAVAHVAFSTRGQELAIAQVNGMVSVRRGEKGRWGPPQPHPVGQTMLGFLPGDTRLACASKYAAWLRDLRTPTNHVSFDDSLLGAAHSTGATTLALLRPDGGLTLWRPDAARRLIPPGQRLQPVEALAFSADGKTLVTGGPEPDFHVTREGRDPWFGIRGKLIGLEPGPCPELRFWSAASAGERPTLPDQQTLGASQLACAADGRTLVSAGRGGVVWVWDLVGRRLKQRFFVNDEARDYWLRWWEVGIRTVGIQPIFKESVQALALSPDSRTLAVASGRGAVTLHDLNAPSRPEPLPDHHQVRAVAFSPDGRTLAVNDGAIVRLWRLPRQAGKRPHLLRSFEDHSRPVRCLAFDPSGRLLASAGEDRRIVLWQVDSGRHTGLPGHHQTVESLAFSPDGRTLASGGADAQVLLWQVRTASRLLTLSAHTGPIRRVAFSPDGRTLASGGVSASGMGEAFLWQAAP